MPQIVGLFGRRWAVGTDDFALLCPSFATLHVAWACLAKFEASLIGAWQLGVPLQIWDATVWTCGVAAFLDVVLTGISARGAILETSKRHHVVSMAKVRVGVAAVLLTSFVVIAVFMAIHATEPLQGTPPELGWIQGWIPSDTVCQWNAIALVTTMLVWHLLIVVVARLVSRPVEASSAPGAVLGRHVHKLLRWYGASDFMIADLVEVLMLVLGDVDLVPSDVLFGLVLVSLRQKQEGRGGPSPGTATALSQAVTGDRTTLKELSRLAPVAHAVYGCELYNIGESAYEGTSIVEPIRFLRGCLHAVLPCVQGSQMGVRCLCRSRVPMEQDDCCLGRSYPLRKLSAESQGRLEILWATWHGRHEQSAPPFAVVLDHTHRELIVTIRGTLSLKDCLVDARCKPEPYDPFWARAAPQTGEEYFAHAGMLACMRDVRERLGQSGVLEEAFMPGGKAHGYRLVCTGHSLGAGIAALLALELCAVYGSEVRFVGFETPGCVTCPNLAREIEERLGWYSLILAGDWVPRLSLRNLQVLREQVVDELCCNRHSKFGLALLLSRVELLPHVRCSLLFCVRRVLSWLRPCLGGGRGAVNLREWPRIYADLDEVDVHAEHCSVADAVLSSAGDVLPAAAELSSSRRARRCEADFYAPRGGVPGRRLVLKASGRQKLCFGYCSREISWSGSWWQRHEDLEEVMVSRKAIESHFSFIVESALRAVVDDLSPFPPELPRGSVDGKGQAVPSQIAMVTMHSSGGAAMRPERDLSCRLAAAESDAV